VNAGYFRYDRDGSRHAQQPEAIFGGDGVLLIILHRLRERAPIGPQGREVAAGNDVGTQQVDRRADQRGVKPGSCR
jgi:hypothetical protein